MQHGTLRVKLKYEDSSKNFAQFLYPDIVIAVRKFAEFNVPLRIPLLIGRKWCRRHGSSIKYGKNAVLNCLIIMRIADIFDDGDDMDEIGENVWVDGKWRGGVEEEGIYGECRNLSEFVDVTACTKYSLNPWF